MASSSSITTVRATHCGKLITHKVAAAGASMAASAENPNLIDKIAFFHWSFFCNELQIYRVKNVNIVA